MPKDRSATHCALCGRERDLTFHHLIPRRLHRTKRYKKKYTREQMNVGIDVCQDCHSAIHRFITEKELGETYASRETLLEHEELRRFVDWVSTQRSARSRVR